MAHSPLIKFYEKRQFGEKINATFSFIRENAWPYIKAQLLISGIILLVTNIFVNQLSLDFASFMNPEEVTVDFFINFLNMYGLLFLSVLVTATLIPIVTYGYMRAYQFHPPHEITASIILKNIGTKVFYLLLFNIIVAILVVLGMFLFIIPAIYLWVVLSLGTAVILFEDTNPLDAIGRSFKLIRGKWWSTFGLIVVTAIIGYIISIVFGLPRSLTFGLKAFTSLTENGDMQEVLEAAKGEQALNVVFSVFETFGQILLYSLVYIALAFQFFNLVERRESRGLMAEIDELDQKVDEDEDEDF